MLVMMSLVVVWRLCTTAWRIVGLTESCNKDQLEERVWTAESCSLLLLLLRKPSIVFIAVFLRPGEVAVRGNCIVSRTASISVMHTPVCPEPHTWHEVHINNTHQSSLTMAELKLFLINNYTHH